MEKIELLQSWTEARDHCINLGGKLFEPRTSWHVNQALEILQEFGNAQFWLGGTDALVDGEWRWFSDGALIEENVVTEGISANRNCLSLISHARFYDSWCTNALKSVCEILAQ